MNSPKDEGYKPTHSTRENTPPDEPNVDIPAIQGQQEDLNPDADPDQEGPGQTPEGPLADMPGTTIHTGQTTRGSYSTDPSTGAGRYMDHTGTFSSEPLDESGDAEPIDPQI